MWYVYMIIALISSARKFIFFAKSLKTFLFHFYQSAQPWARGEAPASPGWEKVLHRRDLSRPLLGLPDWLDPPGRHRHQLWVRTLRSSPSDWLNGEQSAEHLSSLLFICQPGRHILIYKLMNSWQLWILSASFSWMLSRNDQTLENRSNLAEEGFVQFSCEIWENNLGSVREHPAAGPSVRAGRSESSTSPPHIRPDWVSGTPGHPLRLQNTSGILFSADLIWSGSSSHDLLKQPEMNNNFFFWIFCRFKL